MMTKSKDIPKTMASLKQNSMGHEKFLEIRRRNSNKPSDFGATDGTSNDLRSSSLPSVLSRDGGNPFRRSSLPSLLCDSDKPADMNIFHKNVGSATPRTRNVDNTANNIKSLTSNASSETMISPKGSLITGTDVSGSPSGLVVIGAELKDGGYVGFISPESIKVIIMYTLQ